MILTLLFFWQRQEVMTGIIKKKISCQTIYFLYTSFCRNVMMVVVLNTAGWGGAGIAPCAIIVTLIPGQLTCVMHNVAVNVIWAI
jgi:hypothetical protein